MARLIDANELKGIIQEAIEKSDLQLFKDVMQEVCFILDKSPTVDAVPVVRCKDCKHYDNSEGIQWCHLNSKFAKWGTDWHSFPEDGFCSYGERKDNG